MPDALRFFVDENMLAVGKALARVRKDVAHPGHVLLPEVELGTPDVDWLATVGDLRLVALTRDRHIRSRPAERRALVAAGARVVVLTGTSDLSSWNQLELLVRSWARLEDTLARPGPWLQVLTYGGLRDLPTTVDGKPQIDARL